MFKEVNNRHNKREITKSTRLLRSKADRSSTHDLESHHSLLDEDNALIGTSDDEDNESSLYTRLYSSDSYARNKSSLYFLA